MTDLQRDLIFVGHTGQVSGAEVVMLSLARLSLQRGNRVLIASPEGPLVDRLPSGVQHLELPSLCLGDGGRALAAARLATRSLMAARTLNRAARAGALVVVNSLLALPAARAAHVPGGVIWLVHDTVYRRDQRAVVVAARARVRHAVAVSQASAAPLQRLGLRVLVAHNGVEWPVPATELLVRSPPVVGAMALLTPWKGHAVLLEAVARLPGVRLELAGGTFPGDAAYEASLRRRARQPDLLGRVAFLGHVDSMSTLRRWDVAVSSSTSPEAGPISVLEAMSLGVPVVGTDHGGTSEFLADGAGLLVPPSNVAAMATAIHRALHDDATRTRLASTSRQRVAERHAAATTLPAMLDAINAA